MHGEKEHADLLKGRLGRVIRLTQGGMLAERLCRAFWPAWSVLIVAFAVLLLGLHDFLNIETILGIAGVSALALLVFLFRGVRKFAWPSEIDAMHRLDMSLSGRPLQTLMDRPAMGTADIGTKQLWATHYERMQARASGARAVTPDLLISRLDPLGLRYVALLCLCVALLFGSFGRVGSITALTKGEMVLTGPKWEGWAEPPRYTGLPTLYLNEQQGADLTLPENTRIILRFYGEAGRLSLQETVSGRAQTDETATDAEQEFEVTQNGTLMLNGAGGQSWNVTVVPDVPPTIEVTDTASVSGRGEMSLPFTATDDYNVVGGDVLISLDLNEMDRRYGLRLPPEPREPIAFSLPLPISGNRAEFEENLIEDFSEHPWAHLPVRIDLTVTDAAGQTGASTPVILPLPARRFFDPLATTLIEMRRDLLWNRQNARLVSQLLRAVSHSPDSETFADQIAYLHLRSILHQLERQIVSPEGISAENRDVIAQDLWALALRVEDGAVGDAFQRLDRARKRLSEAMKNGASDEEIARLMQELREATEDYMRELARRQQQDGSEQERQQSENTMQLNQDDIQRMMDRIQELMEQGRMAEAEQAMRELQELLDNLQFTEGQGGEDSGEQAMEELGEALREQQGLSDQAFRDLQEQFNPGAQAGQSQGNEGQSGGQGKGESHDGTGQGRGDGQGEDGQQGAQGKGQNEQSLADRQEALRQELQRQRGNLPGAGTESGDAAREALKGAEGAMGQAEEALRDGRLADALEHQSEALDALRDSIRNLDEALAEQQNPGQQGDQNTAGRQNSQDPLGRSGSGGAEADGDNLLQSEDAYGRARELLDEIRRRSGDFDRSEIERNYLERLLDRF